MTDAQALAATGRVAWLPPVGPFLRGLATVALVLVLVGVATFLTAVVRLPDEHAQELNSSVAASLLMVGMAGLALAGSVLARQQPRSTIAWLMLATAVAWVAATLSVVVAWTLLDTGSQHAAATGWVTNWAWVPPHALSMVMLLRFPTGRLPGPRWRPVERVVLAWAAVTVATTALLPGPLGAEVLAPLTNPVGWQPLQGVADTALSALFTILPILVLGSAAAPVVRWRRAGTRERAALRWIAVAAVGVAVAAPLSVVSRSGEVVQGVAGLLLPVAIGAAVLREQLWDLDLRRRYDRLTLAREQERERLRRELHDSLGPVLGSISMRAEAARNLLDGGDTTRLDGLLASIGTATEGALGEVRRLIDDLGPAALQDHQLLPALRDHLAAYADSFPVVVHARPDPLPPLDERAAATAYLVVAEAVRNAARHSGGSGAEVSLRVRGDRIRVEVRDDGRGIGSTPAGVGRSGMAGRVAAEGGRLTVEDGPTLGTVVRFELPGALR
jgi:signal transduction histidine kinase